MILVIDNYDSFVFNIARYFSICGESVKVVKNDSITISEVRKVAPKAIVISPGPKKPKDSGISNLIIKEFYKKIPILGICLGHQALGEVFGFKLKKAIKPMHGKKTLIKHNCKNLFKGIKNPLTVGRYHSLIIESVAYKLEENCKLEEKFTIDSKTDEGEIMSISNRQYNLYGVQFHPESILTENGMQIIKNFLKLIN